MDHYFTYSARDILIIDPLPLALFVAPLLVINNQTTLSRHPTARMFHKMCVIYTYDYAAHAQNTSPARDAICNAHLETISQYECSSAPINCHIIASETLYTSSHVSEHHSELMICLRNFLSILEKRNLLVSSRIESKRDIRKQQPMV